jgi:hypothetical protein
MKLEEYNNSLDYTLGSCIRRIDGSLNRRIMGLSLEYSQVCRVLSADTSVASPVLLNQATVLRATTQRGRPPQGRVGNHDEQLDSRQPVRAVVDQGCLDRVSETLEDTRLFIRDGAERSRRTFAVSASATPVKARNARTASCSPLTRRPGSQSIDGGWSVSIARGTGYVIHFSDPSSPPVFYTGIGATPVNDRVTDIERTDETSPTSLRAVQSPVNGGFSLPAFGPCLPDDRRLQYGNRNH